MTPTPLYVEQHIYENHQGHRIIERIPNREPVEGEDAPPPRFSGVALVRVETNDGSTARQQVEFAIDADTIEQAFQNFEDAANEQLPAMKQDMEQQVRDQQRQKQGQLVVPGGGQPVNRKQRRAARAKGR